MQDKYLPRFNRSPDIRAVPIGLDSDCWVIDHVLLNPEDVVRCALDHQAQFQPAPPKAFPGLEFWVPSEFKRRLDEFFWRHLRPLLGIGSPMKTDCRLSLVNLSPSQLSPGQTICHRDGLKAQADERIFASVLYLFPQQELGGTSFFRPAQEPERYAALFHDARALEPAAFTQKYGIPQSYMVDSNAYFEKTATIPARWNRLIVYDGSLFHSGDIRYPEKLSNDPSKGRLSLNGFFTCRKAQA